MARRIRQRLVLALLATAAVPLAGVGLYSIHAHTQALRLLALAAARDRVELKARKLEELLGEIRSDVVLLARSPMLFSLLDDEDDAAQAAFWRDKLGHQFLGVTGTKPIYASLSYADERGRQVVRARHDGLRSWLVPDDRLGDVAASAAFREAVVRAPGEVCVTALSRDESEAPEPVVRCAVRVVDRRDRRRGVLVVDVFARRLVDAVRDGGGRTWLLDGAGRTVSPAGGQEAPPHAPQALADLRRRLAAGEATVVEPAPGATVTWTAVDPDPSGAQAPWLLAERLPEQEVFADLRRFRLVFAGLVGLVAAAAVGLSLALARRIARPLDLLGQGARRLAGGELSHRLEVRTGDEIEALADEFNRMGSALQDSYERLAQREAAKTVALERVLRQLVESERLAAVGQLAAGVAHEINNPVGVVSMCVEQLLEGDGLSAQQRDKLRIVERHAERLGRITRGLLDFARAREYRRDRFPAAAPVRRALEAMAPRLEEAGLRAALADDSGGAEVVGDEEPLQQVFENLVLNAAHAAPGGRLEVAIARAGDEVRYTVDDDGPGIAAQNLERVFEPFFTTKEVGQGTGLGLAIGYGIVKAHGGRMAAANREGGGARFTVVLPASPPVADGPT